MAVWYPRFSLDLTVPIGGSIAQRRVQQGNDTVVRWTMPVSWFRWEKNDYSQADTLEVRAAWPVAGLDPRIIYNATCEFFVGQSSGPGTWKPGPGDFRFAGIMQKPKRMWSADKRQATLLFHDYTTIFIHEKPFVTRGLPDFGQTLSQAWARICDNVGPTDPDNENQTLSVIGPHLRNDIEFRGGATDAKLGDSVAARFRKDRIGASGPTDAWAVFQQCVQMCGLIGFIEGGHLVITTATDYFSSQNPGRLIMGRNVIELEEERDMQRSASGIVLQSFNPATGTVIEVFSPPLGDSSVRKKHLKIGGKAKTEDQVLKAESREVYEYPGITDPGRLQMLADQIQEVRSRQELSGHCTTGAMLLPTVNTSIFDLLSLKAGDVIRIEIEQEFLADLLKMGTSGSANVARVNYLVAHGYAEGPAKVLVANLKEFAALGCVFFVKSVSTECDTEGDAPSFRTDIHYVNRINPSGNATVDAGY